MHHFLEGVVLGIAVGAFALMCAKSLFDVGRRSLLNVVVKRAIYIWHRYPVDNDDEAVSYGRAFDWALDEILQTDELALDFYHELVRDGLTEVMYFGDADGETVRSFLLGAMYGENSDKLAEEFVLPYLPNYDKEYEIRRTEANRLQAIGAQRVQ